MTINNQQSSEKAYQKYAWIILFGISILLVLNMLFLFFAPVSDIFESDTGVSWAEFSTDYPNVANAYLLEQRLLYAGFLGIALFGVIITFGAFRKGHRWAWYAMWVFPATLTLTAILLAFHDQMGISIFYIVFILVSVIGLLLPYRKFFPKD